MAVNIIFSSIDGGGALVAPLDFGLKANGSTTDALTIYVRHDGDNNITDASMYIDEFSGTYSGDASASEDFDELLAWGNKTAADDFGGFQINQNAEAVPEFPVSSWPTYASHLSGDGLGAVMNSSQGSSSINAIELAEETGAVADGVIQAGDSPNVRFKARIAVPLVEDTVGIRQFDFVLFFVYTS